MTVLGTAAVSVAVLGGLLAACGGLSTARLAAPGDGFPPAESSSRGSAPAGAPGPTSSPTETRSPAALLRAARDAFSHASAVHVTGTAVRGADSYLIDARLTGGSGGRARITTSDETVDVVRVRDVAYVGGDLAFWRSITGDEAKARQMLGSSVKTGADDPNFAAFVEFTQLSMFSALLPDPAAPATLGPPTTIRGTPAVAVQPGPGSTLYVATSGPAFPLRLDGLFSGQVVYFDFAYAAPPVPLRRPATGRVVAPSSGS